MDSMWSLYDLLYEKVEEVVKTGDISPTEMDNVYKAAKTMYYIECIAAMEGADDEYEGVSGGNWPYSNSNTSMRRGRSSRANNSYANSYANNSSRRSSRNSMRNYSGHDQKEMMLQKIAEMQRQIEEME